MGRRTRTSGLALMLDVIVEEDGTSSIDQLTISNVNASHKPAASQNNPTCTLTLQNSVQPNSNGPQFLHTGQWPSMDMVDDTIDHDTESLDHAIDTFTIFVPPEKPGLQSVVAADDDGDDVTDLWGIVTIDQLSMAMDYWDPDKIPNPLSTITIEPTSITGLLSKSTHKDLHTVQQSLFLREIMDEHMTRIHTVEHMEELEDNDSAVEIVAILEGYRQNGWADEMIKAFPKECWLFWTNGGLNAMENIEHDHVCEEQGYPLFRH